MLENDLYLSPQQRRILSHEINRFKKLFEENPVSGELINALDDLENLILADCEDAGANLSAQLSLYPLRQTSLSPCINEALSIFENFGLVTFPGSMSTVVSGSPDDLWAGLQKAFSAGAAYGDLVMLVTVSNACPMPNQ